MPVQHQKQVEALRKADPDTWSMYLDTEIGAALSDALDDARQYALEYVGRFGTLAGADLCGYILERLTARCAIYLRARIRDYNRQMASDAAEHAEVVL
jgi:hypothetical protein